MSNTSLPTPDTQADQTPEKTRRNRRIFIILILVFALPYLAAYLFYQVRDNIEVGRQTNYGQLVQPLRPLGDFDIERLDATAIERADLAGKWLLITVNGQTCGPDCQRNLYNLRQVRRALAEDRRRIERLLVLTDNPDPDGLRKILKDYPDMHTMTGPGDSLDHITTILNTNTQTSTGTGTGTISGRIFIVDPNGDLMMEYPADADPVGILKDLKRLLKLSKIG
jgi:cytochrome oxidase Cu insertion factor (SCO1/SenC/PrrC family)